MVKSNIQFFSIRWFILVVSGISFCALEARPPQRRRKPVQGLPAAQTTPRPAAQRSVAQQATPAPEKKVSINDFKKDVFETDCCCDTKFLAKNPDGSDKHVADVNIRFYDIKTKAERNDVIRMYNSRLSSLFQGSSIRPMVYLGYLRIHDNLLKGKGLGTQLFEYGLQIAKRKFPAAIYFWQAVPLDGTHKKEALFKFYKNRGGIMLEEHENSAFFYIDLARVSYALVRRA